MNAAESTAQALAAANASAAEGVASARLGYQLTSQTLNASAEEAATIFPLLALEATAIAGGFAAFAATRTAWQSAQLQAKAGLARAEAHPAPYAGP
jgi:predicted hotdog family 3-hydroxylacyl-ACP dehydratase